jgi:hypothetical protein
MLNLFVLLYQLVISLRILSPFDADDKILSAAIFPMFNMIFSCLP